MDDYVGEGTLCFKGHNDLSSGGCSPHRWNIRLFVFSWFFFILPLAYSQNDATDLDVRRLKTRGFGQGSAFWGSQFQKITFRGRRPSKSEKLYRRQWGILGQNEIQPQPLNGFRRATAQTTWFRPKKCILGVTNLGRNTWGRCPPKKLKKYTGANGHYQEWNFKHSQKAQPI